MPRRTFLYSCLLAINCNLRFLHCHHTCIVFYYTTSDSHTINKYMSTYLPKYKRQTFHLIWPTHPSTYQPIFKITLFSLRNDATPMTVEHQMTDPIERDWSDHMMVPVQFDFLKYCCHFQCAFAIKQWFLLKNVKSKCMG